ncbi:Alpha/Beta hydrolase protein [Mycena alexandri]|uniref:Alpha/Beta hydrolase protein n=1 Tax=Mycena alexandri TaxID=1745969 RepID=A0AAD6X6S6_9AGAR|nr:Alpha/Beta hydrolase protein [Mycena alexandri]
MRSAASWRAQSSSYVPSFKTPPNEHPTRYLTMSESSFKVAVPDALLDRLQQKLKLTTLPDELEDAGWEYGVPLAIVKRLLARWRDGYDWRRHEAELNASLPQFTRPISVEGHGTLTIHYVHQRSEVADAVPLLFVHGWPGSFIEGRKLVPLLTQKSADHPSFHVVVVSLPGFGFSQGALTKGFGLAQYAEVGNNLMLALGYDEYVTQGGDWGLTITRTIALRYGGKHTKAWHTNFAVGIPPDVSKSQIGLTAKEEAGLERTEWIQKKGMGYNLQQSTEPQTIGYSLSDSPVGLLAWIYEKLVLWSDEYPWDDDEVLTWVSIYWFSRSGPAASVRIYLEARDAFKSVNRFTGAELNSPPPAIPLGLSHFPKDIIVVPKSWSGQMGNVVYSKEHDSGGHFAAYERPVELVDDLREMFGKGGPAFGVVPGKSGYAA